MYRGISFKIPNEWGSVLYNILQGTNYDNYIWRIDEDEVYTPDGDFMFKKNVVQGQSFRQSISSPLYYVVFVILQAFPHVTDICEISNYSEFLQSACEIAMFVCDNIFVDIYIKKQSDFEIIKKNIQKYKYTEIKLLTEMNDCRKNFRAM